MKDIQSFIFDVKNNSIVARYLDIFEFTEDEKMLASALLEEIDHYRRLLKELDEERNKSCHLAK